MIPSAPLGTDAAAGRPLGLGAAAAPGPDWAAAERRFRFELAAHPGSPAQARRLTRARLTGWSVCEDTCDSAALVVSELVTNAIVHTASRRVVCELHDGEGLVRIAVRDEGCAPGEPHPSPQRPEEEHGRGLLLVDALCHAWGTHEHGLGLLVWAELPRKADTPGGDSGPRNDLGWGARPKPGPSGPEDEDATRTHSAAETGHSGAGCGTDVHAPAQRVSAARSDTVEPTRHAGEARPGVLAPTHWAGAATHTTAPALHANGIRADAGVHAHTHVDADAPTDAHADAEPHHGTAAGAVPDGVAEAREHSTGTVKAPFVGLHWDRGRT